MSSSNLSAKMTKDIALPEASSSNPDLNDKSEGRFQNKTRKGLLEQVVTAVMEMKISVGSSSCGLSK